nr:hypothetical protein [Tanacetum cinerariifolium]
KALVQGRHFADLIDTFQRNLPLNTWKLLLHFHYSKFRVRLRSTNESFNWLGNGSNNGLRIWYWSFNLDNRRLDIFCAFVISRRHRVLCHLGLTFYYFRRRSGSRNHGSFVCISTSSGDTLKIFLRLVMVLLGRVPEPEDEASQLAVEESGLDEPELGNLGLDKPVVDKLEAVLTMTSSLEELVSSLVVPLRNSIFVSLIPILILVVLILIASVLILIKP